MDLNVEESGRALVAESDAIEAAIRDAVRDALLRHKQAGNPVAEWHEGEVRWITADEINLKEFETVVADAAALAPPTS